jgi:hypothetical protein
MENRVRLNGKNAPADDQEPTDVATVARTKQTGQSKAAQSISTKPDQKTEVKKWSERGRELSIRYYDSRGKADQEIVAGFREIRKKSKAVKKAFRDALNIENWEATRYRKVGEDDFLHETETAEVFGELTIRQQYELAKAPPEVKRSIREHIRTNPTDKSWRKLRQLRDAAAPEKDLKPSNGTKQNPEASSAANPKSEAASETKLEPALVEIRVTAGISFDTMEQSLRAEVLAWLDQAPKSVKVIRFFKQG